jgi:hypothetical protein
MYTSAKVRLGAIFVCLVMLATAFGRPGASTSHAQTPSPGGTWEQVPNVPTDLDFRNVFMSDASAGIAVGKQGDRGAAYELRWTPLDAGRGSFQLARADFAFRAPLWAAVMVGPDVWAVGEQGLIARRQNGAWSEVPGPVPDAQLLTLQILGNGEEGWAAGFRPLPEGGRPEPVLLHYTGGRWQRDQSITGEGSLNALHFAQSAGWVAGDAGIWRYSNGDWTRESEPDPCPETGCFQSYGAVRAVNSDEAWIVGSSSGTCGICVSRPYILHRQGGRWQIAVNGNVMGDLTRPGAGRELYGLAMANPGPNTTSVAWAVGTVRDNFDVRPYILAHESSQDPADWNYISLVPAANTQLTSIAAPDRDHAVAVGTNGAILAFGYGVEPQPPSTPVTGSTPTPATGPNPTQRVADPHNPAVTYFEAVGHTLRGGFRDYWQQHGALAQFGYPLTEEFVEVSPTDGKPYVTQYFERARFEWHPENRPPYDVLLGLLGRTITQGRENEEPFRSRPPNPGRGGPLYFPETGHFMDPAFTGYWLEHGGLPVYGYPISEAFSEVSPTDGKPYLMQYFERNRLEYHPELPEPFRVSLGLLGAQILHQRGWLP